MSFDPNIGPRTSRAWRAIYALLDTEKAHGWTAIKETARKNSDLQVKSIRNLIGDLRTNGLIEKDGWKYRLTAKGRRHSPPKPPSHCCQQCGSPWMEPGTGGVLYCCDCGLQWQGTGRMPA